MYISPVSSFTSVNAAGNTKRKNISNSNTVLFRGRDEYFISSHAQKLLDNIFHALYKAKQDLGETKILAKGYEITHKYPKNMNINMRKYDPDSDTMIRLDDAVNGTALQVHIDKFREEEFIRFMVQMKDLKDQKGNIHLKKGNVNEFHWSQNFVDRSDRIQEVDTIIETYFK